MGVASSMWEHIQNPVLYALPVFFVFIAVEAVMYAIETQREAKDAAGADATSSWASRIRYSAIDTRTSLTMGLGALGFMLLFKTLTLMLFVLVSVYLAPWHIPTNTWWSWVLLFVVVDVSWYCNHRFSHRVRIGWAAHQAHHSSEYFNFGTALRQKWNPWSEAVFWLPLPAMGFEPWTIYVSFGANLVYQFFSHTETVGALPRPIEFLFNTPSHHRVHHGSDPEYLDKNYGGILIIWDRMFGTFQKEMHTPTYGLTTPVDTYNVLALQYREYGNIIADLRRSTCWRDRFGYVFAPPGWTPSAATRPPSAGDEHSAVVSAQGQ
ncbi:sterol desaturase family protein [Williamsia sterculiae]|uniref:Sterol desaturase/sphingolipid hydroxylase, fatty acid hydroxylase superfamily n=1 Tax=Williamsia sterculiae TaxID=1344003 RepID=A0A1N7ERD6_9NOCA|nr:sterol desaturase family protein [Williamsia sterculiae]SIR90614.1 Sterol desaturase/sphingolipid hydroxylase, fatty acid hydroxylase superfamily [Williamsia sterculiae]